VYTNNVFFVNSSESMGWVGLEPTTNPESFRGCSTLSYRSVPLVEQVNRHRGILFCLELALKRSGRTDVRHHFAGDKLQWLSESTR
jgi:hypothetical protein